MRRFSAAIPSLVEALIDDPFYRSITVDFAKDITAQKRALRLYFAYSLAEAERHGRCAIPEDPTLGAAAWVLPRLPSVAAADAVAKSRQLELVLGPEGRQNYYQIVGFMAPRAERVVSSDAWYLSIVGISPLAQGRGIGARLLQGTIKEAQSIGVGCYLETFTPRSLSFYERVGFYGVAKHVEPITKSEYVLMRRDP